MTHAEHTHTRIGVRHWGVWGYLRRAESLAVHAEGDELLLRRIAKRVIRIYRSYAVARAGAALDVSELAGQFRALIPLAVSKARAGERRRLAWARAPGGFTLLLSPGLLSRFVDAALDIEYSRKDWEPIPF